MGEMRAVGVMYVGRLAACVGAPVLLALSVTVSSAVAAEADPPHVGDGAGTQMSIEVARSHLATGKPRPPVLVEAVIRVAESTDEDDRKLLLEFFRSKERVALLDMPMTGKLDDKAPYALGVVLEGIALSRCTYAEGLLVTDLTTCPFFGALSANENHRVHNARISAIGKLKNPTKKAYDFLKGPMFFHWVDAWNGLPVKEALAEIGTEESRALLWDYFMKRCEKPIKPDVKPDTAYFPVFLQNHRTNPIMLGLAIDFCRRYGDRTGSDRVIAGVSAVRGYPTSSESMEPAPGYDTVKPENTARVAELLEGFLKDPGKATLSEKNQSDLKQAIEILKAKAKGVEGKGPSEAVKG